MNELMMLGLTGGFGSGIDISALIAFLGFAAVYFLAPVVGYQPDRPAALNLALYALISYAGVALVQLIVQWLFLLAGGRPGARPGGMGGGMFAGNEFGVHLIFMFAVVKVVLFLIAMIAFVGGLRGLRLRHLGSED